MLKSLFFDVYSPRNLLVDLRSKTSCRDFLDLACLFGNIIYSFIECLESFVHHNYEQSALNMVLNAFYE